MAKVDYVALGGATGEFTEHLSRRRFVTNCAIAVTVWWVCAIVIITTIKTTVEASGPFPYAFALTSITQPLCGLMAWAVADVAQRCFAGLTLPLRWGEYGKLFALGLLQGVEMALLNKALQFLTVSARTMINSTSVLFVMFSAWFWGLEGLGCLRILSGSSIVVGGVLQGLDSTNSGETHLVGISMTLGAVLVASQRWALTQWVLQRSAKDSALGQMTKLQILARVMPVTGVVSFFCALLWEPQAYTWSNLTQEGLLFNVLTASAFLMLMLSAELWLVHMLSSMAFIVLSSVHQVPIVLAGVLIRNDSIDSCSILGFLACIIGGLLYAWARWRDSQMQMTPVQTVVSMPAKVEC